MSRDAAVAGEVIVLTPCIDGRDGISHVSRLVVAAIVPAIESAKRSLSVFALAGGQAGITNSPNVSFATAHGRAAEFVMIVSRALTTASKDSLVIVLHLHLGPAAAVGLIRGLRCMTFLHGVEAWTRLSWPRVLGIRKSRLLVANSAFTAKTFAAANPAFRFEDIEECHPGIRPIESERIWVGNFALMVGRMAFSERYKGHDLVIEIWPAILKAHPGAELVIAGTGDDENRLKEKVRSLGLTGAIKFMGDVSDKTLEELYRQCRFFLLPSEREGFGLVFLEAMRAGKACIAGIGAASEIIEDQVSGFLVSQSSPELLKTNIVRLFNSPSLALQMGRRARERYQERFTDVSFNQRWMETINSLLAAP